MYMVVARLGCKSAMVGTEWASSSHDLMERLRKHSSHPDLERKHYSHLVEKKALRL